MLRIYFKEKGYSPYQIRNILNSNPFNIFYLKWEKEHLYSNKILAKYLFLNKYINKSDKLFEFAFNEKNSISMYLGNEKVLAKSSINYRPDVHIPKTHTTIISQPIPDIEKIVEGLYRSDNKFIVSACTKNDELFKKKLDILLKLSNEFKNTELCTSNFENHKICTLRKGFNRKR